MDFCFLKSKFSFFFLTIGYARNGRRRAFSRTFAFGFGCKYKVIIVTMDFIDKSDIFSQEIHLFIEIF